MNPIKRTLAALTLAAAALPAAAAEKPNIIFLITDDQANEELGYIEGKALTPNFDRMAAEGVRFNKNYVASSVCSPSRYTCLSGQFASRCSIPFFTNQSTEEGVRRVLWNTGFASGQPIIPRVLQKNGYRTGFVGKWHVNGVGVALKTPKGSDAADPKVAAKLKQNYDAICEGIKHFGFDYVKGAYRGNLHDDKLLVNTGMDHHNMEWLTKSAIDFIDESAGGDEPFYLYFATTLTHVPDVNASLAADPRISGEGLLDEPITGLLPPRESIYERLDAAGIDRDLAKATWLDDGVGAMLNRLDELGIAENTLVVYMNDHGMASRSKGTAYEGGLITPTLAYWPGTLKPAVVDAITQNTDFAPTFFEAAGITAPEDMVLDGKSWLPLVKGEVEETHESAYSEIGLTRSVSTPGWKYIAFRVPPSLQRTLEERLADQAAEYKKATTEFPWMANQTRYDPEPLARYHQMGMAAGGHRFERGQLNPEAAWYDNYFDADQLYDLTNDPEESTNLAADPAHAEKLAEMKGRLRAYLETMPDAFEDLLDVDAGPMTGIEAPEAEAAE